MEQNQQAPHYASLIAQMFVERYYKVLALRPTALSRFYSEDSTVSISMVDANGTVHTETASGLSPISEKVMATIQGAFATVQQFDAQHSAGGGFLLQVFGTMKHQGLHYKFAQSFFLAPQEKGYFVLNDIIRMWPETAVYAMGVPVYDKAAEPEAPAAPVQQPVPEPEVAQSTYSAPTPEQQPQQQTQQEAAPPSPAPPAPAPAPAAQAAPQQRAAPAPAPAVHDVEVPQPAKQATPPMPVAPPLPVNLTYAQRLKLSASGGAASSSPVQVPHPVVPAAASAAEPAHEAHAAGAETNGSSAPRSRPEPVIGVFLKGLPQEEVSVDMLVTEFSKFGALSGGRQGVNIIVPKFGLKTAQIKFEEASAMEAALKAEVVLAGKRIVIARLRPDFGAPPRGSAGGSRGPIRFGSGSRGGRGSGEGGRGGRGGDRAEDRPPRERPEGPRERSGDMDERKERRGDRRPGSNSRRGGQRSGSASRSGNSNKADASAPAAVKAAGPQ